MLSAVLIDLILCFRFADFIFLETSAKLIVQNLLISSYFCTFIV